MDGSGGELLLGGGGALLLGGGALLLGGGALLLGGGALLLGGAELLGGCELLGGWELLGGRLEVRGGGAEVVGTFGARGLFTFAGGGNSSTGIPSLAASMYSAQVSAG